MADEEVPKSSIDTLAAVIKREKEPVFIRCRNGCGNNKAIIVFQRVVPLHLGGGTSIRYQCTRCKKSWHVRY